MTRLLTTHIATMTEMREPHKVLARAKGQPVAILKNSAVIGYLIPIAYVENTGEPHQTMQAVIAAMHRDFGPTAG